MRTRDAEPKNIRLSGPEWEPPGYATAPLDERRWYWKTLADIALEVKRDEVIRGIGINGRKLKPVLPRSRPDGAKGEPLDPHDTDSRTYRLLAGHVMADGVTLFWRAHGRRSWSQILGYHAYKHGARSLPVRNTIGISRGGKTKIRTRAWAKWAERQKAREPKPKEKPKPTPAPKVPSPVPKYKVHTTLPKRIKGPIVFTGTGSRRPPPPKPPPAPKPKPKPKPPAPKPPPPPVPPPKPPAPPSGYSRSIDSAIAWARTKGVEVRVGDRAEFLRYYGPDKADKVFAYYTPRGDEVVINSGHFAWQAMDSYMAGMHDPAWMSTKHPQHVIYHEVGHALHARRIGLKESEERDDRWINHPQAAYATARKVSKYATTNTNEFVAEVYAGLVAGRPFDDDVLKLYDKLEGPSV